MYLSKVSSPDADIVKAISALEPIFTSDDCKEK